MKRLRKTLATVSARDRRTLAIGAGIMLCAWLALRVAPWTARGVTNLRVRSTLAVLTMERAREAVAEHPIVRESLAVRARRLVALAPRLLDGATPAEAGASLAALVGGAATMRQVRVVRQDARPDSSASVFDRVVLRIEAEGDAAGIAGWIADLEEGVKLLRVRSLAITAPEPAASAGQAERLRAELVVEAWAPGRRER